MRKLQWGKDLVPGVFGWMRWLTLVFTLVGLTNIAFAQDSRTICGATVTSANYTGSYPWWLDGTAEIYSSSGVYLGLVSSNLYGTNSILNQYGSYGSPYATNSIFNAFGTYGGLFGANSACNTTYRSVSSVPQIWRSGVLIGYLIDNPYIYGAIGTATTLIAALLRQAYGFSDITAPSIPTGVIATVISSTQINVSWSASQDNVAVTLYEVYINGNLNNTFPASTTSIFHTGLTPSTSYSYQIAACDAANNCSGLSVAVVGTTTAAATPTPTCTLTASPASITSGSSSTLTSSCSPAANSYVWTGGTCAGTTAATCTVTPTGTTTYSVAGVNSGGTGTVASATVTVNKLSQTIGVISFNLTNLTVGGTTIASATATSSLAVTFSSTTQSICTVNGTTVTGVAAGNCTVAADQAGNGTYSAAPQVTQNITVAPSTRLINLSTRGPVQTVDNVMIGGFIVGGSAPKKVLITARGPFMADPPYNVPGTLANPSLQLFAGATPVASNDNWQSAANSTEITLTGLAPTNQFEAAILTTVNPGVPYTAIVTGVGGTTGVALVEVFEADHPEIPLLNISTRARVLTGDNVLIGGFIIQGSGPQQVLITAKGPSLGQPPFNVPGALADPTLDLYQQGTINPIESNDNWVDSPNVAAIQATGNAPSNSLESAIIRTLQPGAYTAIVRGKNGGTGVGLVEVYAK